MLIKNKLDKTFGPVGTSAGSILFIAGLVVIFNAVGLGTILILTGAFIGFSSTSSIIDSEKRRIKFSDNIFGFIETGKWLPIEDTMKLGIKESNLTWRAYSRANRSLDIDKRDYRVALFDADNREIIEISKSVSPELAGVKLDELSGCLRIAKM